MKTLLFLCTLASCGPINPPPPEDENGDEIIVAGPFDQPLNIVDVEPDSERLHPMSELLIRFDRYLDDDELIDFSAVSLLSGGRRTSGRIELLVAERGLVFRPGTPMIEGLDYTLSITDDQIFSETGAPLSDDLDLPTYRIDALEPINTYAKNTASWFDVSDIFEKKCNSCHSDPEWQLPEMTHVALVGQRSQQVDRFLVRAFDPADSYLLQKVLPSYADRRFTVQPPPWSDAVPLSDAEIRTIEFWIASGAPSGELPPSEQIGE